MNNTPTPTPRTDTNDLGRQFHEQYRSALKDLHSTIQRRMSSDDPTPEDRLAIWSSWKAAGQILEENASDTIRQLETKLAAVTEQLTIAREELNMAREDQAYLHKDLTIVTEELKETKKHLKDANRGAEINAHALRINADKLTAVTEQRDRLVEALERILNYQGRFAEEDPESIATEALQSLNQKAK